MSSDQQYPYDPERGYGAPRPQGPAHEPHEPYDRHGPRDGAPAAASDMEATTQTWQGQTWDTESQPVLDWPGDRSAQQQPSYPQHAAQQHHPGQGQGPQAGPHQPPQPGPYQSSQPHPLQEYQLQQPQPPYGVVTPLSQQQAPQSQVPPAGPPSAADTHAQGQGQYGPPYAPGPHPSSVPSSVPSSMEETAYLPATGAGAIAGPGAAPAQAPGALPPEVPLSGPGAAQGPHAAETELLPPVPAHAGPSHAGPASPAASAAPGGPSGHGASGHRQSGHGASAHGPSSGHEPSSSGYSSPTTVGNARITDAQRARAEGRSPIIPPGIQPAGLTAVLGLLLAGGAALGSYGLLVPVVILQAVTAAGWFRLNGMWPARQGIALAFLGGLVADVVLLVVGRDNGPAAIIGTLGVWVLLTVVLQLRSHADPDTRLSGLFATVVSAALAIVATGYLASSSDAVIVGAVAVAVTALVRALPLPGPVSLVASLVVAALAGLAMGAVTDFGGEGLVLGLGAGVGALVGLRAASYDYPSRFVHMTAGVALPLTAAAPLVYVLGRALG